MEVGTHITEAHPKPKRYSPGISPKEFAVFNRWLKILNRSKAPYVLAGASAYYVHTGIFRGTKDLDVFLQPRDLKTALDALAGAGYETEVRSRHWLAKTRENSYVLDLIFGFWNGRMKIDETWIERSRTARFAGVKVPVISLEDLIASKAYVNARDRFDGSDIAHLIRSVQGKLDWRRVHHLLGEDYSLLLWHLLHYDYVYPGQDRHVHRFMVRLFHRLRKSWPEKPPPSYFRGALLDPVSYIVDIVEMGYRDPRDMTPVVDKEGNLL